MKRRKANTKVLNEAKAGRIPVLWFLETDDRHTGSRPAG